MRCLLYLNLVWCDALFLLYVPVIVSMSLLYLCDLWIVLERHIRPHRRCPIVVLHSVL